MSDHAPHLGPNLVGPHLVGHRVTVRYRLDGAERTAGGRSSTDVVGRVVDVEDSVLVVQRRDGSLVRVRAAQVLLLKVVPERPVRPRPAMGFDAEDLMQVASRGWPAVESVALGAWELRASGGFTRRANSAAVHGDPGTSIPEALETVRAFYVERDLAPLAQVVVDSTAEAQLVEAGWLPVSPDGGGAVVRVADLDRTPEPDPRVAFSAAASQAWRARYGRGEELDVARAVLEGPYTVGFAELGEHGSTVAVGRVAVSGEWAGIAAIQTDPEHRRRGFARAVVESCLAWGARHGATKAYVQTLPDDGAAPALYEPLGFLTHHAYRYLSPGH